MSIFQNSQKHIFRSLVNFPTCIFLTLLHLYKFYIIGIFYIFHILICFAYFGASPLPKRRDAGQPVGRPGWVANAGAGDSPVNKQTNRQTGLPSRPPFLNASGDRNTLLGSPHPDQTFTSNI